MFVDATSLETEPVTYGYDEIVAAIQGASMDFTNLNASVRVEDGKVAEIRLNFMP